MNVYNIWFENGDMYTSSGKDESDAMKELFSRYPFLTSADLLKIEPNGGYDEGTD